MEKVWLVGTGNIGMEYAKVLRTLNVDYLAIGRGDISAFKYEEVTGHPVVRGGIDVFLSSKPHLPESVIVATKIDELYSVVVSLLMYGVKKIFVEKPGASNVEELKKIYDLALSCDADVYLAYNRRFYASVFKAQEIIEEDGGLLSMNFEFTEWPAVLQRVDSEIKLRRLFFGNSTHVVDLAFFVAGIPTEYACYSGGCYKEYTPAIFSGSGKTERNVYFNYHANWLSAGRWGVELLTPKHKLYLKPMESLQIQNIASIKVEPIEIDDQLDKMYKPGYFLQTQAFLDGKMERLCALKEHLGKSSTIYKHMVEGTY